MIDLGITLLAAVILLSIAHPAHRLRAQRRWHRNQLEHRAPAAKDQSPRR